MTTTGNAPALSKGRGPAGITSSVEAASSTDQRVPLSYRASYIAHVTAASRARRDIAHAVKSWGMAHLADTARLCASELVTNAVVHTDSRLVCMTVTRTSDITVRITVMDTDRGELTVPAVPSVHEEHGRGLALVDAQAVRWGIDRLITGKRIWCELNTTTVREQ
ncbi:ATP-binding protein [Streptomyces sp. NPDC001787]|uniref:ATP-binding protein n=1 Tax=Streptomyces sp. NPDC001787 TaxID=3154523 RepID=UPI0033257853